MGKPKEKKPVQLPKPEAVTLAKPLVERVARAKARLAKVRETLGKGGEVKKSDPRHRAAKKRVKRAQRRLREILKYDVARPKPAAAGEAAAEAPAS